jgi:hypothetical protein
LGFAVNITPCCPTRRAHGARGDINVHATHSREVDHDATIVHGVPCHVMATAADGQQEASIAREVHRLHDVRHARAAHNHGGMAVDQAVLNSPRVFVCGVTGFQRLASKATAELLETPP